MASRNCQGRRLDWSICQSEQVADLEDPWAKLLFTWLIPNADNCGRLDGEPYQVAGTVFPMEMEKGTMTVAKVERLLSELAAVGLIIWYRSGRLRYIQLPKFLEHQTLSGNMKAVSDYPVPDEASIQAWHAIEEAYIQRTDDVNTGAVARLDHVRTEDNTKAKAKASISIKPKPGIDETFVAFWSLYPRKAGKGQAERAWRTATKHTDASEIIAGLERQLPVMRSKEPEYVKHPSTWLNGKCWLDEDVGDPELEAILAENRNPRRVR